MKNFVFVLAWCNLAIALISLVTARSNAGSYPLWHLDVRLSDFLFVVAVLCIVNMITLMMASRQWVSSFNVRGST